MGSILSWLTQQSTIKGLVLIATAVTGHAISPEVVNTVITAGACLYGLVDVVRNENKKNTVVGVR